MTATTCLDAIGFMPNYNPNYSPAYNPNSYGQRYFPVENVGICENVILCANLPPTHTNSTCVCNARVVVDDLHVLGTIGIWL